jgi:ATP-dependent DNA helicase RecG
LREGQVTNAALILLGTSEALTRWLPQAEVIFEWRGSEDAVSFQDRREFRRAAFVFLDELWSIVNLRNTRQQYRDGLFTREIATFNEEAVREAILNAVSHRDYRAAGSVFVRQSPTALEVESPGPFPPGVNLENIVFKQVPRNRLLAEVLAKCGLVERSGQGVDRMFETAIREGKQPPDFARTDSFHVSVVLRGAVQDLQLFRFLEKASDADAFSFSTADLIVLDSVRRAVPVPNTFRSRANILVERGLLERVSRGRGARLILSRKFYEFAGIPGTYTRKRGLDRQTNKELLARHIEERGNRGSTFSQLAQVLPSLSRPQIKALLGELKAEGRVHAEGVTRNAMWFPGAVKEFNVS